MSLKAFHIFFIGVATNAVLGFGLWCFAAPGAAGLSGAPVFGVASFACALALVVYGRAFLRKMKREGI